MNERTNEAPVTAEDAFAADVAKARDAGMLRPDPAAPAEDDKGEAAPGADKGGQDKGAEARARDESGRFAKKPAPFEGFDELPEHARRYIENLQSDVKREQNRAQSVQRQLSRQNPTPRRPAPTPTPQGEKPAAPQPRKPLPKWEAGSKEFPEHYASLEERIAAGEEDLGRKLTALELKTAELDQEIQESRMFRSRMEAREAESEKATTRSRLDEISPDWRKTVGWIDDDGNPVEPDKQAYRPEFAGWLESQPPSVRALYEAQLAHHDPEIMGRVFAQFDADYREYLEWQAAQNGSDPARRASATPPPPKPQPRAAALQDRQPRPGTGGRVPRENAPEPVTSYERDEAAFAAVTPEVLKRWRGQR